MGPEVKAPTETERTGLTVPVELTTVSTRPRDTVAVTYLGTERCSHHDFAQTPAATTPPASPPRIRSQVRVLRTTVPFFFAGWGKRRAFLVAHNYLRGTFLPRGGKADPK